jgi:hypothetical protein
MTHKFSAQVRPGGLARCDACGYTTPHPDAPRVQTCAAYRAVQEATANAFDSGSGRVGGGSK